MSDSATYNDRLIAEFRENGGTVTTGHGAGLLLLHTIGAKSGAERINPVLGIVDSDADGDGWLIAASKGGSPENPAWYHNLLAHPETEVEVPAGDHVETVPVRAEVVPDADYAAAWERFVARSSGFAHYAERTERHIPVVRLTRR